MARKTALPIARLRDLGCKVSTLLGHWPDAPKSPEWRYAVTLPTGHNVPPTGEIARHGLAYASRSSYDDRRMIVEAYVNLERADRPRTEIAAEAREAEADVAHLLDTIANRLQGGTA